MASVLPAPTLDEQVKHWLGEIASARKRERDFRKEGQRVLDIYYGKKKDQIPFNILYSNTETLLPALYNAQPRPVVQRRFKDEDPIGKVAAQAGQRALEFLGDTNSEEYSSFDDVMVDAVLDALLPGRGASRAKYDADIVGQAPQRYIKSELVCFESLKWDRWIPGNAKKWKRVPWIAFEHDVSEDEAKELFGTEKAAKLQYVNKARLEDREEAEEDEEKTDEEQKVSKVWEIWVKKDKKILYVSPNYAEGFLKEEADPLGLTGFYPMPEPLRFLRKANNQLPTALYSLYENQAKELNKLSVRINRIADALKVRGAYDSTLGELDKILKLDDNAMVAAENVAALTDKGGLEKAIWLMPIDKLVSVFQQLILARQQCKQIIYEITGISDILRGSTVASETATAQEIKNQWGTLRLKRLQKDVARYARDMMRIALEIAAKKFQKEDTWAKMTGLPFATTPEVQSAQAQIAAARSMIAMQTAGQPQQPGQAEQLLQQTAPEASAVLAKPQWAQVLSILKEDTQRMFRIDIETNSTVDLEATEDQKLMGEVLQAISTFIQGISPLIINGSMPFEVAQSMLLAIIRRYRFGAEIEDYIKGMKAPVPPDQGKQQAEQQKMQFELKKQQDEHGLKMQESQAKIEAEKEIARIEAQVRMEELEFKREEIRLKKELLQAQTRAKLIQLQAQVQAAHAMPKKKEGSSAPA